MEFFCYHRDRSDSMSLRLEMLEAHWAYMDRYAESMIARGPTYADDGTLTGSVHILRLPSTRAARDFALDEPCYQAGAYRDVLLRRWHNTSGRTMWDFQGSRSGENRYLLLGFTHERASEPSEFTNGTAHVVAGPLLSDDGSWVLGAAALVEAPDAATAAQALSAGRYAGVEVHRWRFGGRPT